MKDREVPLLLRCANPILAADAMISVFAAVYVLGRHGWGVEAHITDQAGGRFLMVVPLAMAVLLGVSLKMRSALRCKIAAGALSIGAFGQLQAGSFRTATLADI